MDESAMKRRIWTGFLFVAIASISAIWFFRSYMMAPLEPGFRIYYLKNNALLISDGDIISYNWTSQEIAITDEASERLRAIGEDLYSFNTGFVIKINGEEIYRGVFRLATMSAIPSSPKISIMFPSMFFPSQTENYGAIKMFYPFFEPPDDQQTSNAKIFQHFEQNNKLEY